MRKLLSFGFLAAMLVAFSSTGTSAQGQKGKGGQPQGKGGFGGQPGGFGGGMFGGGMAGRAGVVFLTSNPSVQEEIKVTDEQKEKLKAISEEQAEKSRESMKDSIGKFAELKDLDREERTKKMAELQKEMEPKIKAVAEEMEKKIGEVLKPEQMSRVKQIVVQQMGLAAFSDDANVKALKISDEQKEKLKAISDDYTKDQRELRGGGRQGGGQGKGGFGGGFGQVDPETQKKLDALKSEYTDKAMAVLNDEQKGAWKKMTGEPFTVKFEMRRPRKDD